MSQIEIAAFIEKFPGSLIIDVRSPGEFNHAHIPNAISLPLFSDEERSIVGTIYKQQGREQAIKIGLTFFGPKMRGIIEEVEKIDKGKVQLDNGEILMHCWRGGLRSSSMAWLLNLYGFKVLTLKGGYKAFRNWVLEALAKNYPFKILGGYTGSGKTNILKHLQWSGENVINLEDLACHKGSAFGNIGMPAQPGQEMFENLLALELFEKSKCGRCIWIEDESQRIGHIQLVKSLWDTMTSSHLVFLEIDFDLRLKNIIAEYGKLDREKIFHAITRIQKKLGGLETKNAIRHLENNNIEDCFNILLKYYDKLYSKSLIRRKPDCIMKLSSNTTNPAENVNLLLSL